MVGGLKPSEKYTLLIREAAEYFGIGIKRMRRLAENNDGDSAFMQGTDMLLSDRSLRNTYLKKRRGERTVMQRVAAENKDLLNPSETIEYFKLSRRSFMLLSEKSRIMILSFSMVTAG